jgi:imidazolonepropionase-like amidohydrolase
MFKIAPRPAVSRLRAAETSAFSRTRDNAKEIEAMVEFGMPAVDALRSLRQLTARVLHMADKIGAVKQGLFADLIAVEGDRPRDVSALRRVKFVMKNGVVYKQ